MPMMRRAGRPGLIGTAARTAVVVGTAGKVAEHQQRRANERYANDQPAPAEQQAQAPAEPPPAPAAAGEDLTTQLERLMQLKSSGMLTDEEFTAAKAKLLG